MRFYFDHIYNPVYDFIVSHSAPYHELQQACIDKLEIKDGDSLLCAGVGTGNEVIRILEQHPNVKVTGVDTSITALRKIQRKAKKRERQIETKLMDVQNLGFADRSFDKVLCVHVTDFVPDTAAASGELLRVLKENGRYSITFPSGKEDFAFGMKVISGAVKNQWKKGQYFKIPLYMVSVLVASLVYIPFLFRKEQRYYMKKDVENIFQRHAPGQCAIDDFPVYNDFIVHGKKVITQEAQ